MICKPEVLLDVDSITRKHAYVHENGDAVAVEVYHEV